jgi:hypothetical protein
MSEHDRSAVRKLEIFVDDKGREVMQFSPVFGKNKEKIPCVFKGSTTRVITAQTADGRRLPPQQMRFEFHLDVQSLRKAFEIFDECAEKEIERWKKEQDEKAAASRVVGARMGGLMGPDGKPISLKG